MIEIERNLVTLDNSLVMPTFTNSVLVKDSATGLSVRYDGSAFGLNFGGRNLYGNADLARYDLNHIRVVNRVILFPPKIEKFEVVEQDEKLAWHIYAMNHGMNLSNFVTFDHYCVHSKYFQQSSYRVYLNSSALNRGIHLSSDLLDLVFAPIDEQVIEFYERVIGPLVRR